MTIVEMTYIRTLGSIAFFSLIAAGSSAYATTILSTYPVKAEGIKLPFSANSWEAIGFRTGSTGKFDVDSVTLRLSSTTSGTVSVGIYQSMRTAPRECGYAFGQVQYCSVNAPGQMIGSLSSASVSDKADYGFSFADVTLDKSSLYWIVVKGTGGAKFDYYWNDLDPTLRDPKTGNYNWQSMYKSDVAASIYDFATSTSAFCGIYCPPKVLGETWDYHSSLTMIAIDGTESKVPEPASMALLMAGCAGLLGARRRWTVKSQQ